MQMTNKKIALLGTVGAVALAVGIMGFSKDDRDFKISKNLDIFFSVFKELNLHYVDEPDPDKIVPIAINEMLESLDPYTQYIPEKDKDAYNFQINGEYGGVGSVISRSDTNLILVKEVYYGTPSYKSGLQAGDLILSIAGESMRDKDVQDVSNKLRGKAGETIAVEIERAGKTMKVDITREVIKINAVDYYGMLDDEIGYISLRGFETNCAEEVRNALTDLKSKGAKKLILDLRNNPGGLLDEALQIVNFFVPENSKMLSTRGRRKVMDRTYTAFRQPVDTVIPIAVMINRASASASEIVSGAMQDLDRGVVVGQRSYGKGLVQTTREVAYDGYLKVTTAKYYTPSGRCIQAIDYSNRSEEGAVDYVPDSLITAYKTKGGRTVYDGGGISPDVTLEGQKYQPVVISLLAGDYPFRYYISLKNKGLAPKLDASEHLTDETFDDFITFMKNQPKFKYKTRTQDALEKVISTAKSEDLYDANKAELETLMTAARPDLERDITAAKDDIKPLIESEYMLATQYKRGAIAHALQYDDQLQQTADLLRDDARYRGLLDGTVESHAGDKRAVKSLNPNKK